MGRERDGGVAWPGAVRSCELCGALATVHCAADAAFLCAACDDKVHGANFLAARHRRTRLVVVPDAAGCEAASAAEEEDDGYASAASSCVSTADSASTAAAAERRRRGGRARQAGRRTPGRVPAARHAEAAVLECWAKRMGLAPGAARAAARRALLRAIGPDDDERVPPRVAMAAALWWEVAAAGGGGAGHGDALRRLEACARVPARLVVAAVATSMARAGGGPGPTRRRVGASARGPGPSPTRDVPDLPFIFLSCACGASHVSSSNSSMTTDGCLMRNKLRNLWTLFVIVCLRAKRS